VGEVGVGVVVDEDVGVGVFVEVVVKEEVGVGVVVEPESDESSSSDESS